MKQAHLHLSRDPIMKSLIKKHQLYEHKSANRDNFLNLLNTVISQQLSTKAAGTIAGRFKDLFVNQKPTPKKVLAISIEKFRAVGLSNSKASYVKNIAQATTDGSLDIKNISSLSDKEIAQQLLNIKGLGPWSVDMFLMFSLKRPDVFSIGDLGLRTAISKLYGVDREDHQKILKISQKWKPFRTFASRYLWASLDNG